MANIKSAIKRIKVAEKRRLRNAAIKSRVRTAIRRFNEALNQADPEVIKQTLAKAFSVIDKAAAKGVLHKNNAARKKSRLCRKLAKAKAQVG
ncbi:MAG: small subunit ribosomal protein [Bacillota bacterium]|nr:small subunit ribosomal protein [Bacillota bacterium]